MLILGIISGIVISLGILSLFIVHASKDISEDDFWDESKFN